MPKPRYPHLRHEKTRHGKIVWYFRHGNGPRIRLRAEFGTPEFEREYFAATQGHATSPCHEKTSSGTLQWLYARYHDSAAWSALSPATRRQRENILHRVMELSGSVPYAKIRRCDIEAGKDARAGKPGAARNFVKALRGLFRWAYAGGFVSKDPTADVQQPPLRQGPGFPIWTEEDIARYQERWPLGTKERVWLDVLLYTGLRRGDAVRLGRQHLRDGIATIRTEKSQEQVVVSIPILPILAATLKAGPTAELAFICGENGKRLTKESFGNMFREACRIAGIEKSAHGLRKAGATRAAENGATVAELEAIFGWRGGDMASYYTRAADRKRLAAQAMAKLVRTPVVQNFAAPAGKVRQTSRKTKYYQ